MNLTIYDEKGLITYHKNNVNRVVKKEDGTLSVYYDWDGLSFAREDINNNYSWFELGDK